MKIGKLTLDGYFNYGNLLQSYALQQILFNYADKVDTILHETNKFLPDTYWQQKWGLKDYIRRFLADYFHFRRDRYKHISREMVRQGKMRDWADRYIYQRKDITNLSSIVDEYDYFITGSDQVWNPYFAGRFDEFLLFAPTEKRLSYAASISAPEIPPEKLELYKKGLTEMQSLSLREQAGAKLVEQISGRKAEVHVDPTLLLTPDKWKAVSRQPTWYHGKDYILTYFLGNRPTVLLENISKKTGLPVVNLLDDNVYEHYVTGVDEFIWAIEHAKLVYTDSFHGTVFSILFRTPFIVCNRLGDDTSEKMGSRLDTLLSYFGLQNRRYMKKNDNFLKISLQVPDWSKVESVLTRERQRSAVYFKRVLHMSPKKIN